MQTNVAAMVAQNELEVNSNNMNKALQQLSSGYRINSASDDPAGLAMSNEFQTQIDSMNVASQNAAQANSLLQIADGGMTQIGNILSQLKELATQAASANSSADLGSINAEAQSLTSEIDQIANTTTFQGTSLLTGYGDKTASKALTAANAYNLDVSGAAGDIYSVSYQAAGTITITDETTTNTQVLTVAAGAATYNFSNLGISFQTNGADAQSTILSGVASSLTTLSVNTSNSSFQIGETNNNNYRISFQIGNVSAEALSVSSINLSTATGAQAAMDSVDNALSALNSSQGNVGAIMNRLQYTSSNLSTAIENATSAESVIKDTNMATEMTAYTQDQILVQAGTSMLAQANSAPQMILTLIKGQ
jgi:flagellin